MRFHVCSRKGLFTFEKRASSWGIARVDFLGDPVTNVLSDSRDGSLYAVLTLGHFGPKLRRSGDGGQHWEELAVPTFPEGAQVTAEATASPASGASAASLSEIWTLEAGGADHPGRLWAGTIPAAVFVSHDAGRSWQLNESLWTMPERAHWFGGGKDEAGIHSLCVDPRNSAWLSVAVSCGGIWQTRDAGLSWYCRSQGMRAEYMPPARRLDPVIQDPHRLVQAPSAADHFWVQHHNGIYRSNDDCASWREMSSPVSSFGFAVAVSPQNSNTAWFVPAAKDECRVAVDGALAVARTRDGGETFEILRRGLPQRHCYDIVFRHALAVDEGGTTVVFGSSCGNLWISESAGESWTCLSTTLPMIYAVRFG